MGVVKLMGAAVGAAAEHLENQEALKPPDPYRWVKRAIAIAILLFGWMFIIWANKFRFTAPTVFVCLGFLAIELAVYNLFRTGAQIAADEEDDDSTWGRPAGARGELEREKKTLLKAIKEAEFDREMGKLSKVDADEMIGLYRARAIEVIKELDRLGQTSEGTVREQIEREAKARLELERRTKGHGEKAAEKQESFKKKKGKGAAKGNAKAKSDAEAKSNAEAQSESDTKADADATAAADAKGDAEAKAGAETKSSDARPEAGTSSDADLKAKAEAGAKADADSDADAGSDSDADVKADATPAALAASESAKTAAKEAAQ